jgi:hypothetical protein
MVDLPVDDFAADGIAAARARDQMISRAMKDAK